MLSGTPLRSSRGKSPDGVESLSHGRAGEARTDHSLLELDDNASWAPSESETTCRKSACEVTQRCLLDGASHRHAMQSDSGLEGKAGAAAHRAAAWHATLQATQPS